MTLNGKRILVTGGAGFIGSNLARTLAENNEITILDNMHTGSERNIEDLISKGTKLIKKDSKEAENLDEESEVIFHLGMYPSSPMYKEDNYKVSEVVCGAISVFKYAAKNNAKVVFASTSSIYNGHKPPHSESLIPKVTDFYTEARLTVERLAELYYSLYGVKSVGLRFFSVYGPHEESKGRYANLVSQFTWAVKEKKAPLIYGDGSQTRDFVYVDDIVEACIKAVEYKDFGIFNVGTGKAYSLNELVRKLSEHTGIDIKPEYKAPEAGNYVMHTLADTRKAEEKLGFKARYSLDEGIKRLLDYYSDHNWAL